jgi:hypothetical protein
MSDFVEHEDQDGITTLARDGETPLQFANRPAFADWQRRYLYCIVLNGTPSVCFKLHPPQTPVGKAAAHRLRRR